MASVNAVAICVAPLNTLMTAPICGTPAESRTCPEITPERTCAAAGNESASNATRNVILRDMIFICYLLMAICYLTGPAIFNNQ